MIKIPEARKYGMLVLDAKREIRDINICKDCGLCTKIDLYGDGGKTYQIILGDSTKRVTFGDLNLFKTIEVTCNAKRISCPNIISSRDLRIEKRIRFLKENAGILKDNQSIRKEILEGFKQEKIRSKRRISKYNQLKSNIKQELKRYKIDIYQYIELKKRCYFCDRNEVVNIHHRIFKKNGGKDEFDNYIGLCDYHHTLIHKRHYKIREEGDHFVLVRPTYTARDLFVRYLPNLVSDLK